MKSLIPKSRAKTAYGLLNEVKRLILAEPKRYDQGTFIARRNGHSRLFDPQDFPACGTVGCVAGWVATLKTEKLFEYGATPLIAKRILGLDRLQQAELFDGCAGATIEHTAQTLKHAQAGVAHIERFQQRYSAQLRRTKV